MFLRFCRQLHFVCLCVLFSMYENKSVELRLQKRYKVLIHRFLIRVIFKMFILFLYLRTFGLLIKGAQQKNKITVS